ncbi:serine-enriched protein [Trichonephila clavipes]|nr:serine-enriched protein [Trichonephila clavipes]
MSEELAEAEETEDYSVFENKTGLAEDMKFLASMPELCDVTFLVGDTREPVCAVKAVLAARSSSFDKEVGYNKWKSPNLEGCEADRTKERATREKLHKLSMIDTGGLPYEIIFLVDKPYMITANIDLVDGLANGVVFHKILYGQQQQTPSKDTLGKKRESTKETKLKMFLKRSSEPILNIQLAQVIE